MAAGSQLSHPVTMLQEVQCSPQY